MPIPRAVRRWNDAVLNRVTKRADPPHPRPFVLPTVPVGAERAGSLDIYRPAGEGPWPAVLLVHGGPGRPDPPPREWPAYRGYAAAIAGGPVAAAVIDHSLVHGLAHIGQAAAEVTAGADQLRATPGIDPGRIALWFFSGSGLLTASWLEQPPSWLRCVAATYPQFNLPADLTNLPAAADAIARAPLVPVVLTRVGRERPERAAAVGQFISAAASSGASLEIIDVPNGHHGFDFIDHTDESRTAVREAIAQVTAHLTRRDGPGPGQ